MDVEKIIGGEAVVRLNTEEIGAIILALHETAPQEEELVTAFENLPAQIELASRDEEANQDSVQSFVEWRRERAGRQRFLRERSLRRFPPAPPPARFG